MGREVRRVPNDWKHPKDNDGRYIPLRDGWSKTLNEFKGLIKDKGLEAALEYFGGHLLDKDGYMPEWSETEKTHFMMYEDTSEGTPISPAFKTIEELARWLADNKASAFGGMTASFEEWLATCKAGYAISAMYSPETGLVSGVAATTASKKPD